MVAGGSNKYTYLYRYYLLSSPGHAISTQFFTSYTFQVFFKRGIWLTLGAHLIVNILYFICLEHFTYYYNDSCWPRQPDHSLRIDRVNLGFFLLTASTLLASFYSNVRDILILTVLHFYHLTYPVSHQPPAPFFPSPICPSVCLQRKTNKPLYLC